MNNTNNYLGFSDFTDFFTTLTRFRDWDINTIPVIFAAITTFITGYIWDTPHAIWTLWILMLGDYITGIIKSMRSKEFVSYKLLRMPLYFFVTSFTLAISWWLAKSSVLFMPLPSLIYGGFVAVYFISLLENLGELKLLPKTLVTVLKNKFGLKALVKKWSSTEPIGEDKPLDIIEDESNPT